METNKLLAAILTAGIIAMLAGFIAKKLTETEPLKKDAYTIEVTNAAPAAPGAAPATVEPITDLLPNATVAQGETVSKICASCHVFEKGGGNRIGPNLYGVVGRARATAPDFAYSDAMKAKGGSWTVDSLNEFLWNPQAFVPGTKMTFTGLKKPEDRAAIITYLESLK
jgi:cytochrome c